MRHLVALALLVGLAAAPLCAQVSADTDTADSAEAATSGTGAPIVPADSPVTLGSATPASATPDATAPELQDWLATSARAQLLAEQGTGSTFALTRVRSDLAQWRDRFMAEQKVNSGRIDTVRAQVAALGEATEGEDSQITELRSRLQAEIARLDAPALLAGARYAAAAGLISEIDALLRARETNRLTERGQTPLNPALWPDAARAVASRFAGLATEVRATLLTGARWQAARSALPIAAMSLIFGLLLVLRGNRMIRRLAPAENAPERPARGILFLLMTVPAMLAPILGLFIIAFGLDHSGLFGTLAMTMIGAAVGAGTAILFATWLAGMIFGEIGQDESSQSGRQQIGALLPPQERARAERRAIGVGAALALSILATAFIGLDEIAAPSEAVLRLPLQALLALTLFGLGRAMAGRAAGADEEDEAAPAQNLYRARMLRLAGQAAMGLAIFGLLLGMAGYMTAAAAVLMPVVSTLALVGTLLILQRLIGDLYATLVGSGAGEDGPLMPVLAGLMLAILALPVLALIWGARVEDLGEIWARFREGYSLGETSISPTDFLVFLAVFVALMALTRLFQSTMRSVVLPRTRLDKGARNALNAGIGYVGIFLSVLIGVIAAGVDLSSLAIVAGALSVGIGLGLQGVVSNFASGIILLIERPIAEGDWIEVGGQMGIVKAISVRSTRIETFDRRDVIIPNGDLASGVVINWTRGNSVGRLTVKVRVAYGTDTRMVEDLLREIAGTHPMVMLSPAPSVTFSAFGASSLDFEVRVMLRDIGAILDVGSALNHTIAQRFAEKGIEIPIPQQDLWLRNPEDLRAPPAGQSQDTPMPEAARGSGQEPAKE